MVQPARRPASFRSHWPYGTAVQGGLHRHYCHYLKPGPPALPREPVPPEPATPAPLPPTAPCRARSSPAPSQAEPPAARRVLHPDQRVFLDRFGQRRAYARQDRLMERSQRRGRRDPAHELPARDAMVAHTCLLQPSWLPSGDTRRTSAVASCRLPVRACDSRRKGRSAPSSCEMPPAAKSSFPLPAAWCDSRGKPGSASSPASPASRRDDMSHTWRLTSPHAPCA